MFVGGRGVVAIVGAPAIPNVRVPLMAERVMMILGTVFIVSGKICVSHKEYKRNEICPTYPSGNSTVIEGRIPDSPQRRDNGWQWMGFENVPQYLIENSNATHITIRRPH
jgi:hypothetical protein